MATKFGTDLNNMRKGLVSDQSPSFQKQSYQHVYWDQIGAILGQPFDMTKIPVSKLYQMRRDPMIAFALHFIKVPLITAQWYIKCDDAQVAAFIDYSLRCIYGDLVLQYMNSLDFGFAAMVKRFEIKPVTATYIDPGDPDQVEKPIWDKGNIDPVVWKNFVGLPPEMVEPKWDKNTGEFAGIIYDVATDKILGFPSAPVQGNNNAKSVSLDHALWVTNDRPSVFGSIWGYPRVGPAFRYWWSYWYWWALLDRHVEKDADPPAIVRYPGNPEDEVLDDNGRPIDFKSIALLIGEQARSGSTIAMPSDVVESHADGRIHNVPLWNLEFPKGAQNFEPMGKLFDRLEVLKLRSLMVPEQAFLEGSGGTSSRNVASTMGEAFDKSQSVLMQEFDEHINRFVIPQLVDINFRSKGVTAKKVTVGFSSEDIELQKLLITLIGQTDPGSLGVDVKQILERNGVPVLSPEQLKKKQQDAVAVAAASQPPHIPAAPGQAGTAPRPRQPNGPGVTPPSKLDEMVYVQHGGRIDLDRVLLSDFASKFADIPQLQDHGVAALAIQMRNAWEKAYREDYSDFASYIQNTPIGLADDFDEALYLDAKDVPNDPAKTNWVEKLGGLPKKIADMAGDLITERGFATAHAIATAVSRAKILALKHPEWAAALAQWERMKAGVHAAEEIGFMLMLADEQDPDKRAESIVNRWTSKMASATDRSLNLAKDVMKRAAALELKRAGVSTSFDPGSNTVADWVQQHGTFLVTSVDQTVRDELKKFLADQLRAGHSADEIANQIREHFDEFPSWKADRVARTETMLAYNYATLFAAQQAGLNKVQAVDARKGHTDSECINRNGQIFSIDDALQETIKEHPNGTLGWRLVKPKNLSVEYTASDDGKLAWYDQTTETVYLAEGISPEEEERYLLTLADYWPTLHSVPDHV